MEKNDPNGAKAYTLAYVKILHKTIAESNSYRDRALLRLEADRQEKLADLIAMEGFSPRVRRAIKEGVTTLFDASGNIISPEAPKPDRSKVAPTAPIAGGGKLPVTVVAPPPATPAIGGATPPVVPVAAEPAPVVHSGDEWSADLFERYLPATVGIRTGTGAGTGFFISSEGFLLSNHHVVYHGSTVENMILVESGDKKISGNVEVIVADKKLDIALLKLKKKPKGATPFIPFVKDYATVRAGTDMMIIGNGLAFGLAPITGTVKFPCNEMLGNLVYTAPSNGGDSGSPVINRDGNCIGIHKAREGSTNSRGIAYATPADKIVKQLEVWKKEFDLEF